MAEQQPTIRHPSFQLRSGHSGLSAAYLIWRLSEKVTVADSGCWEWVGSTTAKVYGVIHIKNKEWPESIILLHRLVYSLCVDEIPDDICVLHRCDNPRCVCPAHLFLGTNLDNIADKVAKRRQASGNSVRKNHNHLKGEIVKTSRVTAEVVMEIRKREAAGASLCDLAEQFGLSTVHISYIVKGKAWAHLPVLRENCDNHQRKCPNCGDVFDTRFGRFRKHFMECSSAEMPVDLLLGKE